MVDRIITSNKIKSRQLKPSLLLSTKKGCLYLTILKLKDTPPLPPTQVRGFWFCRKLVSTKTQQGTGKARKYNACKLFSYTSKRWRQLHLITYDLFHLNMSSSLSLSGIQQKYFLLCSN